jgi:hypothetical protein
MPSNFALLGRSHHQALGQVMANKFLELSLSLWNNWFWEKTVFIENNLIIAKMVLWYLNWNTHIGCILVWFLISKGTFNPDFNFFLISMEPLIQS